MVVVGDGKERMHRVRDSTSVVMVVVGEGKQSNTSPQLLQCQQVVASRRVACSSRTCRPLCPLSGHVPPSSGVAPACAARGWCPAPPLPPLIPCHQPMTCHSHATAQAASPAVSWRWGLACNGAARAALDGHAWLACGTCSHPLRCNAAMPLDGRIG
jgi:hypothetical protein